MTAPGQMFETERAIVNGIEMTVWKHAPANLRQVLDLSLNHADARLPRLRGPALHLRRALPIASTLAQRLIDAASTKGDRVAIASRNLPQWVIAFWGAVVTGAVVVPINAWWTPRGVALRTQRLRLDGALRRRGAPRAACAAQLDDLTELATIVVISEDPTRPARPRRDAHPESASSTSTTTSARRPRRRRRPTSTIAPDDDATMFYTSGTTGNPKGAVGTHRNAVTNLMNLFFVGQRATLRFGIGNLDERRREHPEREPAQRAALPRDGLPGRR